MIKLEHIKKSFGKNEVLKDVSLDVEKGEVVVILGPSGSGKTTLLRSINFLEPADSGKITIGGLTLDAKHASAKQITEIRRKSAMVFQHYNLFKNKTALENITEGLLLVKGLSKADAEKKGRELLREVGLEDKADAYPLKLSGGQQQRVGIARALAMDPEVILFDEPTSALDPELVGEVLRVMAKVARAGRTMIIVTHEISFAQDIASRIVFMDGGVVVEEGAPKEILLSPKNPRTREFLQRILPGDDYSI
ncbi:MAG: amino acid ABC transporter ATP-binding protein [Fusicatenibacter sp.]|nr:amino acid ABC transporter ATP-binding protein [Lachnospiraceae bacterium]MDY2937784.1 amino acid ABC transporter ATP-binding protein [Fusicatenibacter sp.]